MAIIENKILVYSNISEKMRNEMQTFFSSVESSSSELSRINHIQSKWNAIINSGSHWNNIGQEELKYTLFLKRLKLDIKQETLLLGKKILKEAKRLNLTSREAKKKQRVFIEELEDRLAFIAVNY